MEPCCCWNDRWLLCNFVTGEFDEWCSSISSIWIDAVNIISKEAALLFADVASWWLIADVRAFLLFANFCRHKLCVSRVLFDWNSELYSADTRYHDDNNEPQCTSPNRFNQFKSTCTKQPMHRWSSRLFSLFFEWSSNSNVEVSVTTDFVQIPTWKWELSYTTSCWLS